VPQAREANAAYTVEELVLLGRTSRIGRFSLPGKKDLEKTDETLARLGLESVRKKRCAEISGGELQMALIGRALAAEPSVLILDEPESNLDFRNQLLVLNTMSREAALGRACIFNTHFPAHALGLANKAFMLDKNGGFTYGKTDAVVTEASIARYFGVHSVIVAVEAGKRVIRDVVAVEEAV
jgi:iron complex transport system ATP-binding protein